MTRNPVSTPADLGMDLTVGLQRLRDAVRSDDLVRLCDSLIDRLGSSEFYQLASQSAADLDVERLSDFDLAMLRASITVEQQRRYAAIRDAKP